MALLVLVLVLVCAVCTIDNRKIDNCTTGNSATSNITFGIDTIDHGTICNDTIGADTTDRGPIGNDIIGNGYIDTCSVLNITFDKSVLEGVA